MPVLKHYSGNCHVYVDRAADLDMAERIVVNAKCQRPGVCNAAESLLVHADVAAAFLPRVGASLRARGVEVRGCEITRGYLPSAVPATEADYAAEFLRSDPVGEGRAGRWTRRWPTSAGTARGTPTRS